MKSGSERGSVFEQFDAFAWLWAAGTLWHMASYSERPSLTTAAMVLLAFAVLFGVARTRLFLILLAAHAYYVFERLPNVPNHSILAACIDLTILTAAAHSAAVTRSWHIDPSALYKRFAPLVRIELLALYFFAVFHKLNTGFFHPEDSCAVFMYARLAEEYRMLPDPNALGRLWLIYGTVLVEAAIPIMLVARGLRIAGLLLAFGFHLALALDPGDVVFNFSAMLLALYLLFLPDGFASATMEALAPLRRWWDRAPGMLRLVGGSVIYVGVPAFIVLLIYRFDIPVGLTYRAARGAWVVYASLTLAAFLVTLKRSRVMLQSTRQLLEVPTPALLIFPALLVVNGALPYLGSKTETSFGMYSNLRTEGGVSNHWLMPVSLQIWDYQRDLVRVHRTSVPRMRRFIDRGFQWTYFEFRWLMQANPDASVVYERNGVVKRVRRAKDDPELAYQADGTLRKLLKFRPVSIDPERSPCIH